MENQEIMTIEEVAALIRVSERTVYDWAQKGDIPCGKIGTTWRFRRTDVTRWLNQKLGGASKKPYSLMPIALEALLGPERVVLLEEHLKEDVLNALVDVLAQADEVRDRDELATEIFRREELMSTGIGMGVAVPHVRLASVRDLVMALGVTKAPIQDYESLDAEPVRVVCMIAARDDQHAKHIKALAALSKRLKNRGVYETLLHAETGEEAWRCVVGEEA